MKTQITLLTALLISVASFAQQGINYKAVVKDDSGNLVAGQTIGVQFTILEDAVIKYVENHTTTMTDANGIVILNIGQGTATTGTFGAIDWSKTTTLKTEIDIDGGLDNLADLGTTQFMAVPYAMNADSANFNTINNVTSNNPGDLALDSFVFGSSQMDDDPSTADDDRRMFFNKSKGAFRVGRSFSNEWDLDSIGESSIALGYSAKAKGDYSIALGFSNTANGAASLVAGLGTHADSYSSAVFGNFNVGGGTSTSWVETDPLFEIGNGSTPGTLRNALTVLKNGTLIIGSAQLDDDPSITDDDSRMFFDKSKSAFRAGFGDGGRWSGSNVGQFSTAFGFITIASGARSTAMGSGTIASGFATTAIGNYNVEDLDAYFIIGNGLGETNRKNALVVKSNGDFIVGSSQMDDDSTTPDDNARLFFNKTKGAFRAGLVDDTYWDDNEVGNYSVSMGLNTKAIGQNSFAMGGNSTALGKDAVAMGGIATATGQNAISIGNQTNANGLTSVALGAGTTANGNYSTSMNLTTTADALASTAMGRLNIGTGDPDLWVENEPLFEIGNGGYVDGLPVKSNALTVLKNGTITAPSFDLFEITDDKALITKEYLEANGATGLEQITEESDTPGVFNTGWRLVGAVPANYGPIGDNALDLTIRTIESTTGGATGTNAAALGAFSQASGDNSVALGGIASGGYSTAMGISIASGNFSTAMGDATASGSLATAMGSETSASEFGSTAMGYLSSASGTYSTAMGYETFASGSASTTMGYGSTASGSYSTAMGFYADAIGGGSTAMGEFTTASGILSTAMGAETTAIGSYATSMGFYTIATAESSTAIGKYNLPDINGLFMIGNGDSPSNRNNALVVRNNGDAQFDGEIQRTSTGSANMVPIAYGSFDGDDGTDPFDILGGTDNFTVTRAGDFTYTISVNGQSLSVNNTSASVVVSTDFFRTANVTYSGGDMKVHIFSSTFNKVPAPFQFIIYKN